jgi:hypothetical protein
MERDPLKMYVVYDHPKDFPDRYVVREWLVTDNATPGDVLFMSSKVDEIRATLKKLDLYPIPKNPADDPKILETWI